MNEGEQIINEAMTRVDKAILDIKNGKSKEVKDESRLAAAETCINALYYATDGSLWNTVSIGANAEPNPESFPHGTHINFLPVHGSHDGAWKVMVTMSRSIEDPNIGGTVYMEGSMTNNGAKIDLLARGSDQFRDDQLIGGLAAVTVNAAIQKSQSR